MGMRRAQHVAVRRSGKRHIGDVAAAALDQPRILEPRNRLADREFTHRSPRSRRFSDSKACPADGRASRKTCGLTSTWHALQSGPSWRYAVPHDRWIRMTHGRDIRIRPARRAPTPWPTPAPAAANASRSARPPEPPGLTAEERQNPVAVIGGIIDILRHGDGNEAARKWASGLPAVRRMHQGLRLRRQSAVPAAHGARRHGARQGRRRGAAPRAASKASATSRAT